MLLRNLLFLFLLLFLTGCISFPSTSDKEPQGEGTAFTGLIGGKGVQVGFLPNNPPFNALDGPFSIALKFFNFNQESITVDSFTVGSSTHYEGFTNFEQETLTLEGALVRETARGPEFLAPGTEYSYVGSASRRRDNGLQYGTFQFSNVDAGASTSFFVKMLINDYPSVSYFQFCTFDLEATMPFSCPTTLSLSGSQLGFGYAYDPVTVTNIVRTLSSITNGVGVTLDITIEDRWQQQGVFSGSSYEFGRIHPTDDEQQFSFELESTSGGAISFDCTSSQERFKTGKGSALSLVLRNGKAKVHCTGYDSLFEERQDYQYKITLHYPYEQELSTPSIPLRSSTQQPYSFT